MKTSRLGLVRLEARDVPAIQVLSSGVDAGNPSGARLFDAETGNLIVSLSPFGESFTGGVRTAVGDITGDGVPDLLAVAGPGGGPHVMVVDGATKQVVRSFFAFDPAFTGGITIASADLNRDGFADIITGLGAGGLPQVRAFSGANGKTLFDQVVFDATFTGGVIVAAADVNGDERADLIVGAGEGGGPHVRAFATDGTQLKNFFAFEPEFRGGVHLAAADLNADSFADIIVAAGRGGGPRISAFDGKTQDVRANFFAYDANERSGARVATWFGSPSGANLCVMPGDGGSGSAVDYDGRTLAVINGPGSVAGSSANPFGNAATKNTDAVLDWIGIGLQAAQTAGTSPPAVSRILAMLSTSVFDAVNSITGQFVAYRTTVADAAGANIDAAAAAAAHRVLVTAFASQAASLDAALAGQLAAIADGAAKDNGIRVGRAAADAILAERAADGASSAGSPFTPGSDLGDWVPTPPAFKAALLPGWGQVVPFASTNVAAITTNDVPLLDSAAYAADFNEVKAVGSKTSTVRTADQTQIANFWAALPGISKTPPGMWNQIAARISRNSGLTLIDNARLFAQLNVAMADAGIVAWNIKYTSDRSWRPITAIRVADTDGNAATEPDTAWDSLLTTPNFPSYVSGHSTFSAAAAAVLEQKFGTSFAFSAASDDTFGVVRTFGSVAEAAAEAGQSRIYGGIHFQYDNRDGLSRGRLIGQNVTATLFLPAP